MRNFISPIISEKKPDFLKTDYQNFSLFIDHFYQFLEEQGNPLEVLENFYEKCEVNNNNEEYLNKILIDCGFNIQKTLTISKKELILHLRNFYLSRGNEESFKFLYKILYGCDVQIDYPRKIMFIPSQANYTGRIFVFTTSNSKDTLKFNTIKNRSDLYLKGVSSHAEYAIEDLNLIYGSKNSYFKIQVNISQQQFQKGEGVEIISLSTQEKVVENFIDTIGIEIVNPGKNYKINDKILISNTNIVGTAKVKTLKTGSVNDVDIIEEGLGYEIGDQIFSQRQLKGHSFSAVVSEINNSNNYLLIPNGDHLNLNIGNFTIETWINSSFSILDMTICSNKHLTQNRGWSLKINNQRKVEFKLYGYTTNTITSSSSIYTNKWEHIAITRSVNTVKIYINGVESASKTFSHGYLSNENFRIGLNTDGTNPFIGFLDEFRITKGHARYSGNFIPSNLPYPENVNDPLFSSVSLLLHFNKRITPPVFFDSSNYNNTVSTTGSIYISDLKYKFSDASCFFSGLGGISGIRIYNHGYDYDQIPNLYVQSKTGAGAVFLPKSDYIGQIESIEILDPFVDSEGTPVVSVISTTGTGATFNPIIQSFYQEPPSWKSFEGVLGINTKLLDSYYYQQFSYSTYSTIPRKESDSIVDEWLHPTGFVRFSILDISYSNFLRQPYGGFEHSFYLTIIKIIEDNISELLFNPVYIDDPIIRIISKTENNLLINQISWINWFKDSNNFSHKASNWDLYMSDFPYGTNDEEILVRKHINNNSLPMSEALDVEIEIL